MTEWVYVLLVEGSNKGGPPFTHQEHFAGVFPTSDEASKVLRKMDASGKIHHVPLGFVYPPPHADDAALNPNVRNAWQQQTADQPFWEGSGQANITS